MFRWFRRAPATPWQQLRYLVMDLEMTGLNAQEDSIISAGWVCIEQGAIDLASAGHQYFQPSAMMASDVADSAHIHLITDAQLEQNGKPLADWLHRLCGDLSADVWVFHHAPIDRAFLQVFSQRLSISLPEVKVLDTLQIERQLYADQLLEAQSQLSLTACRSRHGLPAYRQHHALSDALATAELFLVQQSMQPSAMR